MTVYRRRAPMFSVFSFTDQAISARRRIPSDKKEISTSSVASSAWYWRVRQASVAVRILSKSSTESESSSTRMGRRPCSSGIRSEGLERWNAPLAMNRMWSVFTIPYLVETVVPSTMGSRSRCTPWRETSTPTVSPRLAILSISSRNTMPFCSTLASALARRSSSLTRRAASSSVSIFIASRIFMRRGFLDIDVPVVQLAFAQLLAEFLPSQRILVGERLPRSLRLVHPELGTSPRRGQKHIEHALLRRILGATADLLHR